MNAIDRTTSDKQTSRTFQGFFKDKLLFKDYVCRLIYMLSILCVRLTIKIKVGIPESFKVGW